MCFDRFIGLKGSCNDSTLPSNGLWLNTLGVTRDFCENIINSDYADVDSFVTDMLNNANDQLKTDIYNAFTSKFKIKSIIDGARLGFYNEYPSLNAALAGKSKGLQIRTWNDDTFSKMYISTLRTYFAYTGNVNVFVYDLTTGKLLDTIVVASVSGQIVETNVDKTYSSNLSDLNIGFIYSSAFSSYASYFDNFGCVTCNRSGAYRQNKYVYSTGLTIPTAGAITQNNVSGSSDFGGLSVVYSLQCNHEGWLCQNANFFVSAMLYKTAYLINQYADLMSDSFSSMNMDVERLRQRMEYFDFEYKKRLDAGVKNLRIPSSDICFQCNNLTKSLTSLPA